MNIIIRNSMAEVKKIENKLLTYLRYLSERNKMVVFDVAKALAREEEAEKEDGVTRAQVAELDRRWEEYKSGKAKTYTMQEVKQQALKKIKAARRK
jgi:putative addiction module component (TIGR02574 family)